MQPIVSLTPFLGNQWWIKARVIDKSDIRRWNKSETQGELFSCTLVDETAAIRVTFFNDACTKFFPVLQSGQVYYFSGGSVKAANKRFNNVNNEYEATFDKDAKILAAQDSTASIPMQRFNFVPIKALKQREVGSMVDILCVIVEVSQPTSFLSKQGQDLTKRTVKVADKTASVDVTLWNQQAHQFNKPVGAVLAIKGAKIGSFNNGYSLSTTMGGTIDDQLQLPEVKQLRDWFTTTRATDVQSISTPDQMGDREFTGETKRKFFDDIAREGLGRGEKPDYFDIRCMPTFIKTDSLWYDACPSCNKKVSGDSGMVRCEKCDKSIKPEARYMASIQASDNVTQSWLTLFNDTAEKLFGETAAALKAKSLEDPQFLARTAQARLYKPMILRCRVKEEKRDDGPRVNVTVVRLTEIETAESWAAEGQQLLQAIAAYH